MHVYVNQAGYLPGSKKIAVLAESTEQRKELCCQQNKTVQLVDEAGDIVFETEAVYKGLDDAAGDVVWQADFTEFNRQGVYRVKGAEDACSVSFRIGEGIYGELNALLCKALYFQRCGMALESTYAGIFARTTCHEEDAVLYTEYAAMDGDNADALQHFEVKGGWHDAGDFGRYPTAAATALGHILYAWKWFPESFSGELNIPESGNGIPDILNECLYELKWMIKMQQEDGGVWHKLTTLCHADFIMPCDDRGQLLLFPVSSMAVGDFAAVMALACRIYKEHDAAFAKQALEAALKSWNWLEQHPEFVGFQNPEGCNTGEYGDGSDKDERFWAATELYYATGDEKYLKAAEVYMNDCMNKTGLGWADMAGFGGLALLDGIITGREAACALEEKMQNAYREYYLQEAAHLMQISEKGYGVALNAGEYCWGSNMCVLNRGIILATAYLLSGNEGYKNGALYQMDYLLGVNAVGYSYVTGVGERAYAHPHNRVTEADGIEETIPGFVSGGPNGVPADDTAKEILAPGTPPMKCFLDRWECYSLNEITIYWNSPAIFLAAFLNENK